MLQQGVDMEVVAAKRLAHRRDIRLGMLAILLLSALLSFISWKSEISGGLNADTSVIGHGGLTAGAGSFRISGDTVKLIAPGVMVPIDLRITNPQDVSLSVTDLGVAVRRVNAPNASARRPCSVADFALVQARGTLRIALPAHSTKVLSSLELAPATWPQVGMVNRSVNQDGCKGASLILSYTGSGTLGN